MARELIERVEPMGMLVEECTLAGESRDDGAVPAHPNGIQLSRDRFLVLYSTRGFRGRDDEWSAVYRLVADAWDGPLVREGYFAPTTSDWDLFGDGRLFVRQSGHPTAFGVPLGALVGGRRVPHENHFVAMWRQVARRIDGQGHVHWADGSDRDAVAATVFPWAAQFRLNDAADDIEITSPAAPLRQRGFENGPEICAFPEVRNITHNYVCAVPMGDDCLEWVDMKSSGDIGNDPGSGLADPASLKKSHTFPCRYRWNAGRGLYEWVECGRPLGPDLFEGSIARYGRRFVIHARMLGFEGHGFAERGEYSRVAPWCLVDDPFRDEPAQVRRQEQPNWFPTTVFSLPDGSVARLGNCPDIDYRKGRGPVFLVRVDPEAGFRALETVRLREYDDEPRIEVPGVPCLDFPKLLPHAGGRTQFVAHRVQTSEVWRDPEKPFETPAQALALNGCGLYFVKIHYRGEQPPAWRFGGT